MEDVPLTERFNQENIIGQDADDDSYMRVPISKFGLNMLSQMGWTEERGIGKNTKNQLLKPVEFTPRQSGMGLGADPKPIHLINKKIQDKKAQQQTQMVSKTGKNYNYIGDKLVEKRKFVQVNDVVKIVEGKHQGLKGIVTKIDPDNKELWVELEKNDQKVKVFENQVLPEYIEKQKQKILQKHEKTLQKNKTNKKNSESIDSEEVDQQQKSSDDDNNKIKKSSSSDDDVDDDDDNSDEDSDKQKKKKLLKKSKKIKKHNEDKKKQKKLKWVQDKIKVRIISKKIKDGSLYNLKVKIVDILDEYHFCVLTNQNQYVDCLREKDIETLVPEIGGKVKILVKPNKGDIGILISRDKKNDKVVVKIDDSLEHFEGSQDDIAEYVGEEV